MLATICGKCGKTHRIDKPCQCRAKNHKQYDKYKRNKTSRSIYNSNAWRKVTQLVKARCKGIDVYVFATSGRIIPAKNSICHHIEELTKAPELAYDVDNIVLVSAHSHKLIHDAYDKGDGPRTKALLKKYLEKIITNDFSK